MKLWNQWQGSGKEVGGGSGENNVIGKPPPDTTQ